MTVTNKIRPAGARAGPGPTAPGPPTVTGPNSVRLAGRRGGRARGFKFPALTLAFKFLASKPA